MTDKIPAEGFDLVDTLAKILIAARAIIEGEPGGSDASMAADQIIHELTDVAVYVAIKEGLEPDDLVDIVCDRAQWIIESSAGDVVH